MSKPTFSAFHGKQEVKDKYIARMKAHMIADELVQGTGFNARENKGCAIGCTLDDYSHFGYETELGIPFTIAIIEDHIFEDLTKKKAMTFPLEFLEAVPVGADLSLVYNQLEIWHLLDEKMGIIHKMKTDEEKQICQNLAELHQRVIDGDEVKEMEWKNISDLAYRAYRAYRADRADLADRADATREKFIELIKAAK